MLNIQLVLFFFQSLELEFELELIQTQMTQKPMLRVEVGARALRNQTGGGGGVGGSEYSGLWERSLKCVCRALKTGNDRKKE